ncbi:hypothetical protein [Corynebacterium kefirresidentii]|nr:hypothetical protein [Corynebacterium kefirresidentii]
MNSPHVVSRGRKREFAGNKGCRESNLRGKSSVALATSTWRHKRQATHAR